MIINEMNENKFEDDKMYDCMVTVIHPDGKDWGLCARFPGVLMKKLDAVVKEMYDYVEIIKKEAKDE